MKRILFFVLALLLIALPALASVGVEDNGVSVGQATDINFSTGAVTTDGAKVTFDPSTVTGDLTFRSNLLAVGRVSASTALFSSSTNLCPATMPYVVVLKHVGNGLDATDGGTRLQNGTPGQMLIFLVVSLRPSGTYIITPRTCTGFTSVTMDTKGDMVKFLYVNDTIGWILDSERGTTLTQRDLGSF